MTKRSLGSRSDSELVVRFVEIAVEQEHAQMLGQIPKYNRLFKLMEDVKAELKSRVGDQRRLLVDLYTHENMHVRLKAAKATLAIAPEEGRKVLEQIAASKWFPEAGDAGMSLWALDQGIFKPT